MLKPHGLITAVGVLVILGGYAWWANRHPVADTTATPPAPKIISIAPEQISSIRLVKADEPVSIEKKADKWQIVMPRQLAADTDAVTGMTSSLSSLSSD